MDFIGPILEVVGFTGPSICKYIKYHRKLNDFVSNFKRLQEDLHYRKDVVELRLRAEVRYGNIPNPEVTKWLDDVAEITNDAGRVEDKVRKGKYFSRACLGKLVEKKTQEMKLIYDKGNFLQSLVVVDPSSSIVPLPTSELVGEKDVKEKIWIYLEGDQVNKIGLCGMGGIGKTTIMKHIHNELLNKGKFGRIIWVTVSQEFDIGKLQTDIASGLKEKLEEDHNITRRAAELLAILERQGSFVLILDDVWNRFSLEEVGIPEPTASNGCKLVLTTRLREDARSMGCAIIDVKPLEKDLALKLFLNQVGNDILSSPTLQPTLEMIVDECDGLPLAIVTVAGSMRGISDPCLWENALNELREYKRMVAGSEDDKFGILKFSYDHLKDEKTQHCFLYCALYPEDHKIQKDEIIEYWIEEGLIEEMRTRKAMKYKGRDILRKLEDNCLLEFIKDEYKGECVRMHDLLRDMALHITRISPQFLVKAGTTLRELPEEHEWKEDLLKVSLMFNDIEEIPLSLPSPKCPMLTTFLLSHNKISTIAESFFDHMLGLKILDLSYNYRLQNLPNSISKLENLTTLLLKECYHLRKIPSLSNLGVLKKLDLNQTSLEELPQGMEMLTNLRYLDLGRRFGWNGVCKIPNGLLPNLFKLQTLCVDFGIPLKIEVGKLLKMENFMGRFPTLHDMGIFFKSQRNFLSWYNISVGRFKEPNSEVERMPIDMTFIWFYDADIFGEPTLLPSDVQKLRIEKCNDVRRLNDISGFQDATSLLEYNIIECEGMECVLSSWLNLPPSLYLLGIWSLKNLNNLFEVEVVAKSAPPPTTFSSLKTIRICGCPKVKKLFSRRLVLDCLQNLEEIRAVYCDGLEEIIASEEGESEGVSKHILPKLKKLELEALPRLRSICSSTVVSPTPATIFFPLESIYISGCHQLKKLFSPSSLLCCLQYLEIIMVQHCERMEEIIALEEESEGVSKLVLSKLKMLQLEELPALRSICSSTATVLVCDSIKELEIENCSDLNIMCVFGSWFNPLQTLENLRLRELKNLKSVFDEEALALLSPTPATTFFPLKKISIIGCPQLKKLFSPSLLLSCLQNLEAIRVCNCEQMEEVISLGSQEEEKALQLTLPKLRRLYLINLPTLKSICSNISVLRCDSLQFLSIVRCTELKRIPLYLPQPDNGRPLPPPSLKGINAFPKEWWESLEWDYPKANDVLLPFCNFWECEPPWWR